ncbi:hypothetical protein F2P56_002361 [Juglans regia]|uniref:Protein FAR1-RELATED SEQUENCE n=2 Tax=Juglans regia TaxID=51240 RepID=A0A2I4GIR6_JUGRE|nr:protein FAR-RED IMPAIRED RESPONSE 1-like [Juglans regia]KAF5481730.1 hypothetical protein F2P56_002361 [Juglans regia]
MLNRSIQEFNCIFLCLLQNAGYPFPHAIYPPTPFINTSSATSRIVDLDDNRPEGGETEAQCASARVEESNEDRPLPQETEDGSAGTSQNVEIDDDDMIEEPKSGMEFNSFEDLMSYYKQYAKKCEFGVMTKMTERGENETVRYVTLACARGGKARKRTFNVTNPRPTRKTKCKAMSNALKSDGKLRLNTVHNIHNHSLSPKKSRFFRCNREVSDSLKIVLNTNDLAGIRMNKSFGSLIVGAGVLKNLPFLEKDCRNYIDKARHLRLGTGGSGALREYFYRIQYKNLGFFALMDLDDDGSEDTETFVWLFKTWLQCIDGIAPKSIITDQDRAMKNAIAIVHPETRHRFCLWHILKKVSEKLGSYASYKIGMKNTLMKYVYDTQNIEEFERCWDQLIVKYNLHENAWLQSLYTEREHWVPTFLKEYFWAGMSTTQRIESMNAFFDGYVHAKTNLKEFVDQFENALKKKIENENATDVHWFSVTIPCISRSPIEKRFQDLYTNAKFKEVQLQITGIFNMNPKLNKSDDVVKTYLVEDGVRFEEFTKLVTHSVDFSEADTATKYILDRWRKDIKRRYTLIRSSYDAGEQQADSNIYSELLNICYQMITDAASSKEHTEDAKTKLYAMMKLYRANQQQPSITQTGFNVDCTVNDTTTVGTSKKVLSPHIV